MVEQPGSCLAARRGQQVPVRLRQVAALRRVFPEVEELLADAEEAPRHTVPDVLQTVRDPHRDAEPTCVDPGRPRLVAGRSLPQRPQALAVQPGARFGEAGEIQDRRHHVHEPHLGVELMTLLDSGHPEHERDHHDLVVGLPVPDEVVLAEGLAVVGGEHHDGVLGLPGGLERFEEALDLTVHVGDAAVVEALDDLPVRVGEGRAVRSGDDEGALLLPAVLGHEGVARGHVFRAPAETLEVRLASPERRVDLVGVEEGEEGLVARPGEPPRDLVDAVTQLLAGDLDRAPLRPASAEGLEAAAEAELLRDVAAGREGHGLVAGVPERLGSEAHRRGEGGRLVVDAVAHRVDARQHRDVRGQGPACWSDDAREADAGGSRPAIDVGRRLALVPVERQTIRAQCVDRQKQDVRAWIAAAGENPGLRERRKSVARPPRLVRVGAQVDLAAGGQIEELHPEVSPCEGGAGLLRLERRPEQRGFVASRPSRADREAHRRGEGMGGADREPQTAGRELLVELPAPLGARHGEQGPPGVVSEGDLPGLGEALHRPARSGLRASMPAGGRRGSCAG